MSCTILEMGDSIGNNVSALMELTISGGKTNKETTLPLPIFYRQWYLLRKQ